MNLLLSLQCPPYAIQRTSGKCNNCLFVNLQMTERNSVFHNCLLVSHSELMLICQPSHKIHRRMQETLQNALKARTCVWSPAVGVWSRSGDGLSIVLMKETQSCSPPFCLSGAFIRDASSRRSSAGIQMQAPHLTKRLFNKLSFRRRRSWTCFSYCFLGFEVNLLWDQMWKVTLVPLRITAD